MKPHPEARPDEIWVGNTCRTTPRLERLQSAGMKTLRLGNVAYDIHGHRIPEREGIAPLFIGRSEAELYNDIMMEATFGPNWRRR